MRTTNTNAYKSSKIRTAIVAALTAILASSAIATQYSKLAIVVAAKAIGKWDVMNQWIKDAGYWDEWLACQYFSDDYPGFSQITNAVVSSGITTEDELATVLSLAVDTGVSDALLLAKYNADMQSDAARRSWHGGAPTTYLDWTNSVKILTYPDGYAVTNKWQRPKTPEERAIEAAARQQQRIAAEIAAAQQTKPAVVAALIAARAAAATASTKTITVDAQSGEEIK